MTTSYWKKQKKTKTSAAKKIWHIKLELLLSTRLLSFKRKQEFRDFTENMVKRDSDALKKITERKGTDWLVSHALISKKYDHTQR